MGRATLLHRTPGMVSTSTFWLFWASWKALMLLKATSNASLTLGSNSGSGRSCGHISAVNDYFPPALWWRQRTH